MSRLDWDVNFLDNPKDFYEPGDKLKAEFILMVSKKPLEVKRIECRIKGYVKCIWDTGTSLYNGYESYIDEYYRLLNNKNEGNAELAKGIHKFDIVCNLPSNLPTSFFCEGGGAIKYKMIIKVVGYRRIKLNARIPIRVIRPLNLNVEALHLRSTLKEELSKKFKFDFTSEPLYMSASIPFSAYVPGQTINIRIIVNNQSKTDVKELNISLAKLILLTCKKPKDSTELKCSEVKLTTSGVPALTVQHFEKEIVVPPLPPSISNCELLKVHYQVRVKAITSGLNRWPVLILPITIGTIPFEDSENPLGLPPPYETLGLSDYDRVIKEGASDDEDNSDDFPSEGATSNKVGKSSSS
ncbi:CLUMA_CG012208, isoform A [Clunio marinus]|uniref:CLUMA_CG012208, isoform A n=1 Tax=Clunio marinus TaxID=568069 RepID=A0A1J1IJH1_9DIPT|nr:CLUMA_CG012208, isoform A [Clunio marinus]